MYFQATTQLPVASSFLSEAFVADSAQPRLHFPLLTEFATE